MQEMTVLANALTSDLDRFEAFRRDDRMGYFYIVEYTNGMVKIGSTRNPKARMQGVHYAAKSYAAGAKTRRVAISAPHALFRMSEVRLHKQLEVFRIEGTELFRMPFDDALKHCNTYSATITQQETVTKGHTADEQVDELGVRMLSLEQRKAAAHRLVDFMWDDPDIRAMPVCQIRDMLWKISISYQECHDRAVMSRNISNVIQFSNALKKLAETQLTAVIPKT